MRRAPFVAGATVLGMVGILTFHSQGPTSVVLAGPKAHGHTKAQGPGSPTTTASPSGQPVPTSTPPSTSTPASSTTPTAPAAPVIRSAFGPTVQYGYGSLAVKVTVSGNKITDVSTHGLQTADPYSQQLADQVIPMLRSQVLHAQKANINGVSGATYTAQAYATSLQAALDHLHVP